MKRREFITLLGGAAAWPLAARAQQAAMPVVGFLDTTSADFYGDRLRGFRQGLKDAGYVEGENVAVEYRWAEGHYDRFPALVADLVRRHVVVIVTTGGTGAAIAVKAATATIPIVFLVNEDPVRHGLVASLARPGGTATGINFFTAELNEKRLGLLRELVPKATRIAVLVNPVNAANAKTAVTDLAALAHTMGLQIQVLNASSSQEIDLAFATFLHARPDALFVVNDAFFTSRRVQLVNLTLRHAVPATYSGRQYAEVGGLMSYGPDLPDAFRQVGIYTGHILKGEKPADLPVMQPTKYDLVINLKTAKTLGLTVPPMLLARADWVIE
jgi:putative ABC transport system substrate-binding protein